VALNSEITRSGYMLADLSRALSRWQISLSLSRWQIRPAPALRTSLIISPKYYPRDAKAPCVPIGS
jgi:hypothetical protein